MNRTARRSASVALAAAAAIALTATTANASPSPHRKTTAAPAAVSYYYSGPVECVFDGINYDYVLVQLTVQASGHNHNRAYQIAYGNALPAQRDNSEVITHVTMDEYDSHHKHVGHTYDENRPKDKGGWTKGLSTYYSPWELSNHTTYETVVITNIHKTPCTAKFSFHQ